MQELARAPDFKPTPTAIADAPRPVISLRRSEMKEIVERLAVAMTQSWSVDTLFDSRDWNPAFTAINQCATTSLVVQDHLGGKIVECEVQPRRQDGQPDDLKPFCHFHNELPDGSKLDFTRMQFRFLGENGFAFFAVGYANRDDLLNDYPYLYLGYRALKAKVAELLR